MRDYEIREKCGSCQDEAVSSIIDLGDSPPANGDDEKKYPLQLGVCLRCSLLQQMTVLPDERLFSGAYHFYSSASAPKVEYHRQLAELLRRRHLDREGDRPLVVEIACNDGDLLRHLANWATVIGVEPAHGPATIAQERGLTVINKPFSRELAKQIRDDHNGADLIIANHVIAHIIDINDFAAGIARLLSSTGVAVIEVQYAQDMITANQFDHIYHEHRYHYTVKTLNDLMSRYGLYLADAEWIEPQGGSIRCTFTKLPPVRTATQDQRIGRLLRSEYWMSHPQAFMHNLQGRANWMRDRLVQLVEDELATNRTVAGYGATAKSVSLINFCGFDRDQISYVVDTTPHKAGRHIPGTDIPIVAPSDVVEPDTYVMWAWNYASHILRKEDEFTHRGGRWIIPTPFPTVI